MSNNEVVIPVQSTTTISTSPNSYVRTNIFWIFTIILAVGMIIAIILAAWALSKANTAENEYNKLIRALNVSSKNGFRDLPNYLKLV